LPGLIKATERKLGGLFLLHRGARGEQLINTENTEKEELSQRIINPEIQFLSVPSVPLCEWFPFDKERIWMANG